MKKILFSLFALFACFVAYAETDSGVFEYIENGEVSATIELNRDGSAVMRDVKYGETKHMTYNIQGAIQPGQIWTIEFYHNGNTHRGTWAWPVKEGKTLMVDGMTFYRAGYSKYRR